MVDLPSGDSISLLNAEGGYLARSRDFESVAGTKQATAVWAGNLAASPDAGTVSSGVERRRAPGSADRIVAWHRVPDTSLVASVDVDLGATLLPIETHFGQERISAGILCLLLIVSVLAVFALAATIGAAVDLFLRAQ